MHDSFGYALVIEMRDLLTHDEVLEKRGPAAAGFQRVLIIVDSDALICG